MDNRGDFTKNEVATDYNAGFTSALARLYQEFGGQPLANFPTPEAPDDDEIFVEAGVNASGTNFTEIRAFVINKSAFPARMGTQLSFRYFFTLEPGVTPGMITINTNFNQGATVSAPQLLSGSTYFVRVDFTGTNIYPGGQSASRKEIQFRMASSGAWDPTNDWSFTGIATTPGAPPIKAPNISVYEGATRVFGAEPGPATPDFALSASPASLTVNRGASGTSAITITRTGGFTGGVTLSASGLPDRRDRKLRSDPATGGSSVLTLTASSTATLGAAAVTITGTGGGLTRTTPISLTVNQPATPDFALSASPASLTVARGASGTSTITITRTGGFTGGVTLSASGLPAGVTASFSPNPATGGSSVLTLAASSAATLGAATITVTGTGGGLTRSAYGRSHRERRANSGLCSLRKSTEPDCQSRRERDEHDHDHTNRRIHRRRDIKRERIAGGRDRELQSEPGDRREQCSDPFGVERGDAGSGHNHRDRGRRRI